MSQNLILPSSIKGGLKKTKRCSVPCFACQEKKKESVFSTIRTNLPPPVIDAVKLDVCGTLALANEHIN